MKIFKDLKEIQPHIDKIISSIRHVSNLNKLGGEVADLIRGRTTAGYGCSKKGGNRQKLAPLKPNTIKIRRVKNLDGLTKPNKSNLTESGDMLDNITHRVSNNTVIILFADKDQARKAYFHNRGTKRMRARPFFNLTRAELRNVERQLQRARDEAIKALFS